MLGGKGVRSKKQGGRGEPHMNPVTGSLSRETSFFFGALRAFLLGKGYATTSARRELGLLAQIWMCLICSSSRTTHHAQLRARAPEA
jgi:hypothetical protein